LYQLSKEQEFQAVADKPARWMRKHAKIAQV